MINRSNYSDYFMLYADGELNAPDMQMVEAFVAENADLTEEFDLYMETKITPDEHISMPNKNMLLKAEIWNVDNLTEAQSELISYIDNEATKPLVAKDLNVEAEISLLQKTLLQPEVVPMPNKEKLYKEERNTKPIFVLFAKRIAVAAAFLLAGMFVVEKMTANMELPERLAAVVNTDKPVMTSEKTDRDSATNTVDDKHITEQPVISKVEEKKVEEKIAPVLAKSVEANNKNKSANITNAVRNTDPVTTDFMPENNDAAGSFANMRQANESVIQVKNLAPTQNILQLKNNAVDTKEIEPVVNPNAYTASVATDVKETTVTVPEDDTEYIYIVGSKVKKQKFRGIARTINRGIDKIVNPTKRQANVNE